MRSTALAPLVVALTFALTLALPRLAHAAEPTVPECVAASNESVGLRAEHKLHEARARLLVCVAAACPSEIRAECSRRLDEVTAALPTVVFVAQDAAGRELSAVTVTVDGEVVAASLDGGAVALDPGQHQVTFEVAGRAPASRVILVHEGERNRREVLAFEAAPTPPLPPSAPAAAVAPERLTATGPLDAGHTARLLGIVAGGAGVAGLVAGAVTGALTFSSWGAANRECPTHSGCSSQAEHDRSSALTFSSISNVAFVAGGVLLAAGVTLYLTAPKKPVPALGLELAPGALGVSGHF